MKVTIALKNPAPAVSSGLPVLNVPAGSALAVAAAKPGVRVFHHMGGEGLVWAGSDHGIWYKSDSGCRHYSSSFRLSELAGSHEEVRVVPTPPPAPPALTRSALLAAWSTYVNVPLLVCKRRVDGGFEKVVKSGGKTFENVFVVPKSVFGTVTIAFESRNGAPIVDDFGETSLALISFDSTTDGGGNDGELYFVPQKNLTITVERRLGKQDSDPAVLVESWGVPLEMPVEPARYKVVTGDQIEGLPKGTILQEYSGSADPLVGSVGIPSFILVSGAGVGEVYVNDSYTSCEPAISSWRDSHRRYIIRDDLTISITI